MTENKAPTTLTIRVWMDGREPFDVETRWIDSRNYERTAFKHKWPPFQEAPFTWLGFLAWSAARRTGDLENTVSWETFEITVLNVENIGENEVTPTEPGAIPG